MAETPKVGKQAYDLDLPDSTGRKHTLPQLLSNGNVVLVFFRGVW